MNFSDIQSAIPLSNEKLAIQRAIQILTSGGRITSMTVTGGTAAVGPDLVGPPTAGGSFFMGNTATVQTGYIIYPLQMVDAIVSAFNVRLQEVTEELARLGVTGMEQ